MEPSKQENEAECIFMYSEKEDSFAKYFYLDHCEYSTFKLHS